MEFGSEEPRVIYVALRWNDTRSTTVKEESMIALVSKRLKLKPTDLRIYNLVHPSKGRGMSLPMSQFDEVEQTVRRIRQRIQRQPSLRRIVVGGATGPMPHVALILKLLLPQVRIELRNHHRARVVNGGPLSLVRVIRN